MAVNSALVRKIRTTNLSTGKTVVKHLIGLRKIHLAPDAAPDAETLNSIPSDSVELILETDPLVDEIELYADELILLGGTQLSRPGKKISIVCRTATIVGSKCDVTFSVQKLDDPPPAEEVKDKVTREENRKGADAQPSAYPFPPNESRKTAESGKAGDSGPAGNTGNHAGGFYFRGSFNLTDQETRRIVIEANGGRGGKGGPGENGGAGGNGLLHIKPNEFKPNLDRDDFVSVLNYIYGAAGGQGGNGGLGGQGGNGGVIDIKYAININDAPLKEGQVAVNKDRIAFDIQIGAGEGGEGGEPASCGDGGKNTKVAFEMTISHPFKGDDGEVCKKLEGMGHVNSGLDGYDQTIGGDFPMVITTSWAWFKLNPDKIPSVLAASGGSKGGGGPNGQNGTQTVALVTTTAAPKTTTDLLSGSLNDAFFTGMVLDRLIFEYFMNFATQVYDLTVPRKPDPKVAPALELTTVQESFWRSWEWARAIIDVSGGAATGELESALWAMPKAALLRLDMMAHGGKDIFNASLNAVPNPTSGIPETSAALEDFEKVSQYAKAAIQALEQSAGKLTELNSNIQAAKDKLGTLSGETKEQDAKSTKLEGQIRTASLDIQNAVQNLEAKSEKLKDKIQGEFHADFSTVIEAVSMVCMFANPEAGAAFAVGSLLSVGSAASHSFKKATSTLETETGVPIDKKFVIARMQTFMSDGDKLREDISQALVKKKKEEVEKGEEYLTQLRVDAQKFDAMAESYIAKGEDSDAVKAAFKRLIEAVQTKNNLIQDYNECQAVRAQQKADAEAFQQTMIQLEKHKGNDDSSSHQLRGVFFNQVYSDMARKAFEFVYEVARNYNCIALGPTTLFKCLRNLQSFTLLTPDVLQSALKTYLIGSDIHSFKPLLYSLSSTTENTHPLTVRLTKDKDSEYLDQLKDEQRRGFTFFFTPALADALFPDSKNWWDVRLVSLEVYLIGAVATTDAVRLEIGTPGVMSYRSKSREIHQFKLPPQHTTFGYGYKQPKELETFKPVTDNFSGRQFKFTLAEREERTEYKLPMESPFAAWTLKAYDSVNVGDVDEVVFKFTVCYRTL